MTSLTRGNIVDAKAEALVNTVNCEGYMGKGIALQFKRAFPENFRVYQRACRAGEVRPGHMLIVATGSMTNPKYVINFPTKRKWRQPSRMDDIESGLRSLVREVRRLGVASVAVPPLGCGHGGLDWRKVRPLIEGAFADLPNVHVILFEPAGTPDAAAMPVRTARPRMTIARAYLIRLMQEYAEMGYRLTLLEVQKLAYFLQESGLLLRLKYVGHLYGPYAHNLNKVLETLEGHFIRGYGDSQKPDVEVELLAGAIDAAGSFLSQDEGSTARLRRVSDLIEGFKTPYGMELLASVHWVAVHTEPPARTAGQAIAAIQRWDERKRRMFRPEHVEIAWTRLGEQGWVLPNGAA